MATTVHVTLTQAQAAAIAKATGRALDTLYSYIDDVSVDGEAEALAEYEAERDAIEDAERAFGSCAIAADSESVVLVLTKEDAKLARTAIDAWELRQREAVTRHLAQGVSFHTEHAAKLAANEAERAAALSIGIRKAQREQTAA